MSPPEIKSPWRDYVEPYFSQFVHDISVNVLKAVYTFLPRYKAKILKATYVIMPYEVIMLNTTRVYSVLEACYSCHLDLVILWVISLSIGMYFCLFTQDNMLFCDACDKGYHMACHQPKVKDKPSGILIVSLGTLFSNPKWNKTNHGPNYSIIQWRTRLCELYGIFLCGDKTSAS